MEVCSPGMREYELQAELEAIFRRGGSERVAYESIVGSGENATILHYRENRRQMESGDLVLIDAGAELGLMAADITRTFPVSGRFSEPQRKLYDLVLAAHSAALAEVRPKKTLEEVHGAAFDVIAKGLCELGWIDADLPQEERDRAVRRYFMHRTSHYLGMDVHDVGPYQKGGESLPLEPGVVITVEPGLYVSPGDERAPEAFWSIGIRIEDDVLVEGDGSRILTDAVPRTVPEIEALCHTEAR
jgi:Xaa-Pro aminopeptidase